MKKSFLHKKTKGTYNYHICLVKYVIGLQADRNTITQRESISKGKYVNMKVCKYIFSCPLGTNLNDNLKELLYIVQL